MTGSLEKSLRGSGCSIAFGACQAGEARVAALQKGVRGASGSAMSERAKRSAMDTVI